MRTKLSDAAKIQRVAERNGWIFYPSYSGRFMYGNRCPGIVCGPWLVSEVKKAVRRAGIKAGASYDSLGREAIVYWPSVEADPAIEEDESEMSDEEREAMGLDDVD